MTRAARKTIAWPLVWACYLAGDAIGRLSRGYRWRTYGVYNTLMVWSYELNEWAGLSVWK